MIAVLFVAPTSSYSCVLVAAMVFAAVASEPTCLADLLPPTSAAAAATDAAVNNSSNTQSNAKKNNTCYCCCC